MKDLGKTEEEEEDLELSAEVVGVKIGEIGNGRHSSEMKLFLVWSEI